MKRIILLLLTLVLVASSYAQRSIEYIALELDDASRQLVIEYAEAHLPWADARVIAHHMTIVHHTGFRAAPDATDLAERDYVLAWALAHEGQSFSLTATEVGHSNKAFALRITDVLAPSRNRIKHITLATNNATGGRAVDSNYITHWEPLDAPLVLTGKVTIYYK
ncbi:MAG: hypothetical protein Q4D23_04135 [Bacteroidales bacterium]|nr:hypothetical protein [Bacteroidales bacterium]